MVINNEAELKAILMPKIKNALVKAQEKVYKIVDLYVQRFYADYDPVMYERTYALMHSLVKDEIVPTANGFKARVYFDISGLQYATGARPSGEQVMGAAAFGGHGAKGLKVVYGSGEDLWYTPLEILDADAINILKNMLISEGIPIK